MPRAGLLSIAALLLVASSVQAQEVRYSSLRPGDRIRILNREGSRLEGTFVSAGDGFLRWRPGATEGEVEGFEARAHYFSSIRKLEQNRGKRSPGARAILVASSVMAVAGGIINAQRWEECPDDSVFPCPLGPSTRGQAFALGALIGGLAGVPTGGLAALVVKLEAWEEVALPTIITSPGPPPSGRIGFGVSLPIGR